MKITLQERARETEDSLLEAAETLLRKGGLETCTVPAIARLAERSVGAVYRRFPDKDVLLRTVFRRYFTRAAEQNGAAIMHMERTPHPLPVLVYAMVRGMIIGQRRERRLIAALLEFARTHPDARFRREAKAVSQTSLARFRELMLACRSEITHACPERAVDMALAVLSLTVQGMLQRDELTPLPDIDDDSLARDLTAMVLAYMGAR